MRQVAWEPGIGVIRIGGPRLLWVQVGLISVKLTVVLGDV